MLTAIASLLIIAFCIFLLAIVTGEYLIVSLDQISERLKLPANVAGASLMAVGSSAPELAIALLALFKEGGAHSDVGIATIVGSAVFNILVITGASAIARPANITWRVVVRDVFMYLASISLLLITFYDGNIILLEALAFLGLYAIYIFILFNWESVSPGKTEDLVELVEEEIDEERKQKGLYFQTASIASRGIGLLMGNAQRNFVRAFLVSIAFIIVLSWFLVEYAVVFADAVNIPPVIVALTILAVGTSVPDLFASVVVARQGRGEMAIANAVGSNIFDILIGLGLPWLIAMVVQGQSVHVGTEGLWLSIVVLFATVLLLSVFLSTHRQLSRREGWLLLLVYIGYVLWTVWSGT